RDTAQNNRIVLAHLLKYLQRPTALAAPGAHEIFGNHLEPRDYRARSEHVPIVAGAETQNPPRGGRAQHPPIQTLVPRPRKTRSPPRRTPPPFKTTRHPPVPPRRPAGPPAP